MSEKVYTKKQSTTGLTGTARNTELKGQEKTLYLSPTIKLKSIREKRKIVVNAPTISTSIKKRLSGISWATKNILISEKRVLFAEEYVATMISSCLLAKF